MGTESLSKHASGRLAHRPPASGLADGDHHLPDDVVDERREELILGPVVPIQCRDAYVQLRCQPAHREPLDALGLDDTQRNVKDAPWRKARSIRARSHGRHVLVV